MKIKLTNRTLANIKNISHKYYIDDNIFKELSDVFTTQCYVKATLDFLKKIGIDIDYEIECLEYMEGLDE